MSLSRRTFIGSGLAGAAASAFACGRAPAPPTATPAGAKKKVLFVVQGTFVLATQTAAKPPRVILPMPQGAQVAHDFIVRIEAKWMKNPDDPEWDVVDGWPDWRTRTLTAPVTIDIDGAGFEGRSEDMSTPASDACPEKPRYSHGKWADPKFISWLKDPRLKLRADWDKYSSAYIRIPNGTKWYGRAPRFKCDQNAMWQFKDHTNNNVGNPKAITDVVGFRGELDANSTIKFYKKITGDSAPNPADEMGTLELKLGEDTPEVWFIARPKMAEGHVYKCAEMGEAAPHFDMLYNVAEDGQYRHTPYRADNCAGSALTPPTGERAYDIFCPGGEIEGG